MVSNPFPLITTDYHWFLIHYHCLPPITIGFPTHYHSLPLVSTPITTHYHWLPTHYHPLPPVSPFSSNVKNKYTNNKHISQKHCLSLFGNLKWGYLELISKKYNIYFLLIKKSTYIHETNYLGPYFVYNAQRTVGNAAVIRKAFCHIHSFIHFFSFFPHLHISINKNERKKLFRRK